MSVRPGHDISLPDDPAGWFSASIEIPKGSKVKHDLDKDTGLLKVCRVFCSVVYYAANHGFVPRTCCEDGGPLDVLVLGHDPVVPVRAGDRRHAHA